VKTVKGCVQRVVLIETLMSVTAEKLTSIRAGQD